MDLSPGNRPNRYKLLGAVFVLATLTASGYVFYTKKHDAEMAENFGIKYPHPYKGWKILPHGPQTLFLYSNEDKGLLLRGAVNQMISTINPTPNLDRDNLAQLMVDNTHDNMPGWSAAIEDKVEAKGTSFRIVRRSERRHVVVTAFAVKGNTTVLITLSGRDGKAEQVDRDMKEFHDFISNVSLTKEDMSNL